jgi:hypothetical protein
MSVQTAGWAIAQVVRFGASIKGQRRRVGRRQSVGARRGSPVHSSRKSPSMTVETGKESFLLGFLTAIEVPERGFVGGLLVTNHFGRPLEFQCTAPLKPNRAQEILYGPTLVPYVLGDLIGRTLIEKVGVKPHLVLTERNDLLPLRDLVTIPVACVDEAAPIAESSTTTPAAEEPSLCRLGRQILRFHAAHADDQAVAQKGADSVPNDADLREPFERVREALNETAQSGAAR